MGARFGPSGNAESFYASGHKETWQAPQWLAGMGLSAYEYQCGRGVRLSDTTAEQIRAQVQRFNITVTLHAPYYISLASNDPQKRERSVQYIVESARAVTLLGGDRVVVHPGGLGGLTRQDATSLACDTLSRAQCALDGEGLGAVHLCPETMGKVNQLGTLQEVLRFCEVDSRFLPCVDFGHLNARTHGQMNSPEAFSDVLHQMEIALGEERAAVFHVHFSKIEYTAGGEKRHLTFADSVYGPNPAPLMDLIARRGWSPIIICESCGTQAEDAVTLNNMYRNATQTYGR